VLVVSLPGQFQGLLGIRRFDRPAGAIGCGEEGPGVCRHDALPFLLEAATAGPRCGPAGARGLGGGGASSGGRSPGLAGSGSDRSSGTPRRGQSPCPEASGCAPGSAFDRGPWWLIGKARQSATSNADGMVAAARRNARKGGGTELRSCRSSFSGTNGGEFTRHKVRPRLSRARITKWPDRFTERVTGKGGNVATTR
jgi:hypothetical protein